jgi:hypothetical protein
MSEQRVCVGVEKNRTSEEEVFRRRRRTDGLTTQSETEKLTRANA